MMKSGIKIFIENLQKDLKKLNEDYEAVAEKKRRESDPVEKRNSQLRLDSILKEIEEIDQKIKDLKDEAEESKNKELEKILSKFTNEDFLIVQQAHRACSPDGWEHLSTDETNKPEKILVDVLKMRQGDSKYTRVEHFVTCLFVVGIKTPLLTTQLRDWADKYIDGFDKLFHQEKHNLEKKRKNKDSYLLIVLEKSNQDSASKNSDCYRIQAWTIKDKPKIVFDSQNQTRSDSDIDNQTITIDKIADILEKILNEAIKYEDHKEDFYKNLMIEIFLPLNLLNHPVDCWEFKDGTEDLDLGFSDIQKSIGQKYKVVVRSYERWRQLYKKNQYRYLWETKWKQLENSGCSAFSPASEDTVNDLIQREQEIIGIKIVKAPEKIGKGSIFAAMIKTKTPMALWLRNNPRNLDYCQSEIERILKKCSCVHDLPNTLKDERSNAKLNVETDIGNHISLLWENPYRLPPDINYSM